MKVKDLILKLQECPPDNEVVVDGYEGGVTMVHRIVDNVLIALNVHSESYYGEHEIPWKDGQYLGHGRVNVTYIPR